MFQTESSISLVSISISQNPVGRKRRRDWAMEHFFLIEQFADQANQVQNETRPITLHEEYMSWYWGITRRWIFWSVPSPIAYQPAVVY